MSTAIRLSGITKRFPGVVALKNVGFEIQSGEVHCLVGENGAGKSTLIKLLAGVEQADEGTIELFGKQVCFRSPEEALRAGVGVVYQELSNFVHLDVATNLNANDFPEKGGMIDYRALYRRTREQLDDCGLKYIHEKSIMRELSLGTQQMVEIASLIGQKARVVILDEPTSALTEVEVDKLYELIARMKQQGVTIIYITHRLDEVLSIADRVSVLRDGHLVATRDAKRATPAELIAAMVGREVPSAEDGRVAPGRLVLRVSALRRAPLVRDVSFEVRAGDIVGIAGLMGSGRTETLRCIFGADQPESGQVWVDGRSSSRPFGSPAEACALGVGFLPEDRRHQGLVPPMAVRANLTLTRLEALARAGWVDASAEARAARDLAASLDVRCRSVEQPVSELSGGNQQKVAFGRWLLRGCRVLLCDEPSRGIDVAARAAIHHHLRDLARQGVAVVVASSDLPEVIALADRVVVLSRGVVARVIERAEATEAAITEAAFAEHLRAS